MHYGFETQRQAILPDFDNKNTFIARMQFAMSGSNTDSRNRLQSDCLYQGKLSRSDLRGEIERFDKSEADKITTVLRRNDFDVPKSNVGDSVFNAYYSKYPTE